MKTLNLSQIVKGVVLATALVAGLAACGRPGNENNFNVFQQDNRDPDINGQSFFEATTRAYSINSWNTNANSLTLNWRFAGQNTAPTAQNYDGVYAFQSPALMYSGKVSAVGTVVVSAPLNLYFCGQVPAGNYELGTEVVGRWNQGQISGIRLIARGPVTFVLTLSNTQAYDYSFAGGAFPQPHFGGGFNPRFGGFQSKGINGTMMIEQVNGFYCQGAFYNLF